jgi:hypothetical protein
VEKPAAHSIMLMESGGGLPDAPESFTIQIDDDRVMVRGQNTDGLRDGVVKLVDLIGFRQAPFLHRGQETYRPRLPIRLGGIPTFGSCREVVFNGYNAMFLHAITLPSISTSKAIPELTALSHPEILQQQSMADQARQYGLNMYASLYLRQLPKDHPVFAAHPDLRGALTWKADGDYVICTEHPLMRQWLMESVEGLFRAEPALRGAVLIIGGEGFYHCFMRPYGVTKGHTACPRCEALGPDVAVLRSKVPLYTGNKTARPVRMKKS